MKYIPLRVVKHSDWVAARANEQLYLEQAVQSQRLSAVRAQMCRHMFKKEAQPLSNQELANACRAWTCPLVNEAVGCPHCLHKCGEVTVEDWRDFFLPSF